MRQALKLALPYLLGLAFCGVMVWDGSLLRASWQDVNAGVATRVDPVCGMSVGPGIEAAREGHTSWFCSAHCRDRYLADPARYRASPAGLVVEPRAREPAAPGEAPAAIHTMLGIPDVLYYASIALVLLLSFGIFEWTGRGGAPRVRDGSDRIDLLLSPGLRHLLAHPWTRPLARAPVLALFLLILVAGLFGSQDPRHNAAPVLTWTIWWCGLVVLIMYAGKAWCYVCPWDALAGWAERARSVLGWGEPPAGRRWPRALRTVWPATLLFVLLTWVEIGFGVTQRPMATALLALLLVLLAVVSALFFDRRAFCRHACLIGRISGLYALFSPVEVRAADAGACRSCPTSSCQRGNQRGAPCPTSQHLARLDQNTYCIACMECVKSCERQNVALNLRPWGEDLVHHRAPRSDEAYLALVMLSLTGFHGLTMTGAWGRWMAGISAALGSGPTLTFTLGMLGLTVAPIAAYAALVRLSRWAAGSGQPGYREYFVRYAYALLPIALFYHLAHNSEHLLLEGTRAISLISDPLGRGWDLFGTARWTVPPLLRLSTVWGVQVALVLVGHLYSLWVARHVAAGLFPDRRSALWSQLPMLAAMILFSVASLWLLRQPMELRTSAM